MFLTKVGMYNEPNATWTTHEKSTRFWFPEPKKTMGKTGQENQHLPNPPMFLWTPPAGNTVFGVIFVQQNKLQVPMPTASHRPKGPGAWFWWLPVGANHRHSWPMSEVGSFHRWKIDGCWIPRVFYDLQLVDLEFSPSSRDKKQSSEKFIWIFCNYTLNVSSSLTAIHSWRYHWVAKSLPIENLCRMLWALGHRRWPQRSRGQSTRRLKSPFFHVGFRWFL